MVSNELPIDRSDLSLIPWEIGKVDVVGERRAIRGGAREGVSLRGVLVLRSRKAI